jgi:RNA polymerase sigma factor (sigma-70 family)
VRQALLYRRRCGRQRRLLGDYSCFQIEEGRQEKAQDPFDLLLQDERRTLVREALWRLPRRDREILLLKYTEDWTYRELAEKLGVTESAVEARLHRARKRLRETLIGIHQIEEDE